MQISKKKAALILFSIIALVACAVFFAVTHLKSRAERMRMISDAIANPRHVDAEALLNEIDISFQSLGQSEKDVLLNNPAETENRIAEATSRELKKNLELLFLLPSPIRKRVIEESADELRRKALQNPDAVDEIFNSPGGQGALRGASKFFLLDLSGKQKSEMAPMTQAMFEIVKRQCEKKAGKSAQD